MLEDDKPIDEIEERFGFREIKAEGRRLFLNGEPIYPRGWLTWGLYPEQVAPAPTPEQVRKEFSNLFSQGFNMSKNCLWMPPTYYYDIADEMGVLIWLEYPTWQTARMFGPETYPEWDEMFIRDRNRACIVIRSLTCEAPLGQTEPFEGEPFKYLYNRAHELIPNSIIIDNSGFFAHWAHFQKEMYTDAYSDHPYLDCHHFNAHLDNLVKVLEDVPQRPLITGESMDCDTWRDSVSIRKHYGEDLPYWLEWDPNYKAIPPALCSISMQEERMKQSEEEMCKPYPSDIVQLSYNHQLAHVKYQVEEYRKRPEFTGYTLIGVRDSALNTPGFHDDLGRLKHTSEEMRPWNADTVLLLDTHRGHFNFRAGESQYLDIIVSCFDAKAPEKAKLSWSIMQGKKEVHSGEQEVEIKKASPQTLARVRFDALELPYPEIYVLYAELDFENAKVSNTWKLWTFPHAEMPVGTVILDPHGSLAHLGTEAGVRAVIPDCSGIDPDDAIVVSDCITPDLVGWIEKGGRAVVYVHPEGSLPAQPSPFWREATEVFVDSTPLRDFPQEGFVDLQFLPVSSNHKLVSEKLKGKVDVLMRRVNPRTFLYGDDLVQMRVGDGALVACTLGLLGPNNFTGAYIFSQLTQYAVSEKCQPHNQISSRELISLVDPQPDKE